MIELWHCADARSFRPLWAMEELGVPYRLHALPYPPRVAAPEFLRVNPLGTVPALRDGSTFMTESSAILQYLVTRYGPTDLAAAPDDEAYGAWLNWLAFGEATLTVPLSVVLRYRFFEPGRADTAMTDYIDAFLTRLEHVENALADREWLCADRFTAADISVGYALLLASFAELGAKFPARVRAYWERLQARPAFQAAKRAQAVETAPQT